MEMESLISDKEIGQIVDDARRELFESRVKQKLLGEKLALEKSVFQSRLHFIERRILESSVGIVLVTPATLDPRTVPEEGLHFVPRKENEGQTFVVKIDIEAHPRDDREVKVATRTKFILYLGSVDLKVESMIVPIKLL